MPNNRYAKSNTSYAAKPQCWKCDAKKPSFVDEGGLRQYTCSNPACGATWNDLLPNIPNFARENALPRAAYIAGLPTHGKGGGGDDF